MEPIPWQLMRQTQLQFMGHFVLFRLCLLTAGQEFRAGGWESDFLGHSPTLAPTGRYLSVSDTIGTTLIELLPLL